MLRGLLLVGMLLMSVQILDAASDESWPHPFPCRVQDGPNPDLLVMTLGPVSTPLAQGVFDPVADEVRLHDGRVLKHYYRDSLGVEFYQPIDKSHFPLPPSGWCSWYFYYQEISADEVLRNAKWIASNLKDYGASVVQIDDGWQGTGHGLGDNRDWTTIDKRFAPGMDVLASRIRELGLTPGLWLAPHGQSNPEVVKAHPGAFLLKPDGTSASDTWEGKYLVDPSTEAGQEYLANLFRRLVDWGYDYFKIDGQPIVIQEYRTKSQFFGRKGEDPVALYRKTLRTIRKAIGEDRYLLGCWGIPLPGVGIMNGSRTGGDIVLGWDGFLVALNATMRWYFLHNVVWYNDPDVMLLREPLTLDQARVWATLQGLTGQALLASDRLPDLGPERVEILRKVFPAVDIRPMDLFPYRRSKKIWDLKIAHLGRQYDVVGCFNFDEEKRDGVTLRWQDLGYPEGTRLHVFDFWADEYLGAFEAGFFVPLAPTSCRVLTLVPVEEHPVLVSTNRHITQGWVDLKSLKADSGGTVWSGESRVIRDDPYELHFAFPPKAPTYRAVEAEVRVEGKTLPTTVENHQGWATIRFRSPVTGRATWTVRFGPAEVYTFPVKGPHRVQLEPLGLTGVDVRWPSVYASNCGYEVWLDERPYAVTPTNWVRIRRLDPKEEHRVEVKAMWDDGTVAKKGAVATFRLVDLLPSELFLSDLEPVEATAGWGTVRRDRSSDGGPLRIGGKRFSRGLGTHAESDIVYRLNGLFERFEAVVGVDDETHGRGSVVFEVFGDGRR
ncbi:MAG: hypothetical protein GXO73_09495, partial [Calditrichaeota bacterium]|nr:hypothetical protein [Calditrichota bacterium]